MNTRSYQDTGVWRFAKELGMEKIPVIVRNLTDEQAVSTMVDVNLHRENILPSERAFAYKMKWEAAKKIRKDFGATCDKDEKR